MLHRSFLVFFLIHITLSLVYAQQAGSLKWAFPTGGSIESSPAIADDGTIYIGSRDSSLYAINPDGTEKWRYTTRGEILTSPVIGYDGSIYIGSCDSTLYAVNPDGSLNWTFSTNDTIYQSPAIGPDSTIYIGAWDTFYALSPDGNVKWSYILDSIVYTSPVIGLDGSIYVSTGTSTLYAFSPQGGQLWTFSTGYPHSYVPTPAIGIDGTLYFGGGNSNTVYALNPNGTVKWSQQPGSFRNYHSTPTIGPDSTIYIGNYDYLYALFPDGAKKWIYPFEEGGNLASSPAIGADGMLYFGGWDHRIYALNANGAKQWSYTTGGYIWSSPVLDLLGTLYIASADSHLYALHTSSPGLADSPWPAYRKDVYNRANSYRQPSAHRPVAAVASDSVYTPINDAAIMLDASASFDPDGDALTFNWTTTLQPTNSTVVITDTTQSIVQVQCSNPGFYEFTLTVSDGDSTTAKVVKVNKGIKWTFDTGYWSKSTPAIAPDSTIYYAGRDSTLHALRPDGTEKWRFKTNGVISGDPMVGADGTVYVGSWDFYMYAIHPDGTEKWRYKTGSRISCAPAYYISGTDTTVYVASQDNRLLAINVWGFAKWRFTADGRIEASPVVDSDGSILFGTHTGTIYRLNPDGSLRWSTQKEGSITGAPTMHANGRFYVGTDHDGNTLYAFEPNGEELWKLDAGKFNTSVVIDNSGSLYAAFRAWKLLALYPDGGLKWQFDTGFYGIDASPTLASDGTILLAASEDIHDYTGVLYALNANGELLWSFASNSTIYASPVMGPDGNVYITSDKLYALDAGLQLADSPWPKSHRNNQNQGYQVDATPPAKVTDMEATFKTNHSIVLKFNGTGDDGLFGRAAAYDLRFQTYPPESDTLAWWNQAGPFDGGIAPALPGAPDSLRIDMLAQNTTYYFILRVRDEANNWSGFSNVVECSTFMTGLDDENALPTQLYLHRNFPNPFNPETTIRYELPSPVHVRLVITDVTGRQVRTLLDQEHAAGFHQVIWNGRDDNGLPVATGVYFSRLESKGVVLVRKMALVR